MAKDIEKFEHLEKVIAKKYIPRDKKTSKPKMLVTGKRVFQLQKIMNKPK